LIRDVRVLPLLIIVEYVFIYAFFHEGSSATVKGHLPPESSMDQTMSEQELSDSPALG
jgi:hypothetical protein